MNSKTLGPGRIVGVFHGGSLLSVVFPPDPPHHTIRAYTLGGRGAHYDIFWTPCGEERIRIRDVEREIDLTL